MRLFFVFTAGILAVLSPRNGFGQTVTESFNDTSRIDTAASSGYLLAGGALRSIAGIDLGTGADGPCSVRGDVNISTGSCVDATGGDAVAFPVTVNVSAGQANVVLASAPTGLTVGDEVLIINLRGNAATVGQYETHRIQAIAGKTLTLDANLAHAYDGTTSSIMVQRVPNYTSVAVSDGAKLFANGFNGTLGGVLFIRVQNTMRVDGTISMSGLGYRGGRENLRAWNGGYRGEGPDTSAYGDKAEQTYTQSHGAGGGGDADHCATGQGGGGGGHGSKGSNGGAVGHTCEGDRGKWFFNRNETPETAQGGETIGTADLATLLMGPGGGSGGIDGNDPDTGGGGGAGGGIIVIAAQSVTVKGNIRSDGLTGFHGNRETGGGGGGAGGSILLEAHSLDLDQGRVTANGGAGGSSEASAGNSGGGGSVGRIAVHSSLPPSGRTSPPATLRTSGYSRATVTSTNLLAGTHSIGTINTFHYSLSSLPAGSFASVQFSLDGVDWYDHLRQLNHWAPLSQEPNSPLSLSALGWSGSVFYYRLRLDPTATGTPVLDEVTVAYCADGIGDACALDGDRDGIPNASDNCELVRNPDQLNTDGDAKGDACDDDDDNDTVEDSKDNCPLNANQDQRDTDADRTGDVCDSDADADGLSNDTELRLHTDPLEVDTDRDGIRDDVEVGPLHAPYDTDGDGRIDPLDEDSDADGAQDRVERGNGASPADTDGDNLPDYRDPDSDDDGVKDDADNCRIIINASQADLDGDGQGNVCDSEMDGDGLENEQEAAWGLDPRNPDSDGDSIRDNLELGDGVLPRDADGDGELNGLDTDSDEDGVPDQVENEGALPGTLLDTDGDGLPDYIDTDSDNDEVLDPNDSCRLVKNPSQVDLDRDGTSDDCDADIDGDGLANIIEERFGLDPMHLDSDGDGVTDAQEFGGASEPRDTDADRRADALDEDSDNDGFSDGEECGVPRAPVDTDRDGQPDYIDEDSDADGHNDGQDNCRLVGNVGQQDTDRDGRGDACDGDLDGDTVANSHDNCPMLANSDQLDTDANLQGDACDPDDDGDDVADTADNCQLVFNPEQHDTDQDGPGDACDPYDDGRMAGGGHACSVGDGSAGGLAPLLGLLLAALRYRRSRPRAAPRP